MCVTICVLRFQLGVSIMSFSIIVLVSGGVYLAILILLKNEMIIDIINKICKKK